MTLSSIPGTAESHAIATPLRRLVEYETTTLVPLVNGSAEDSAVQEFHPACARVAITVRAKAARMVLISIPFLIAALDRLRPLRPVASIATVVRQSTERCRLVPAPEQDRGPTRPAG